MSTYRDKIRKYQGRVDLAHELGLPPKTKDLKKLYYYRKRAAKKGPDHDTKLKDKFYWAGKKAWKYGGYAVPLVKYLR